MKAERADWEITVPVVSTAHLPPEGFAALQKVALVAPTEHGCFVLVTEEEGRRARNHALHFESEARVAVLDLLVWFREAYPNEFWLRLDNAGAIIPTLRQYPWP